MDPGFPPDPFKTLHFGTFMGPRVLPETELSALRRELEARISEVRAQISQAELDLHDAQIQLKLVEELEAKLIPTLNGRALVAEEEDDEDDDGTRGMTPTRAIMDLVETRPGLTRDEIYLIVTPRLTTRANDKRTLVVNILRRLVARYKKLEEVNGRYYLAGQAPDPYEVFESPSFDDDDDLPF